MSEIVNIGAEMATLGSIIVRPAVLEDVLGIVVPSDFVGKGHAELLLTLTELKTIDPQALLDALKRKNQLEYVGGVNAIHTLMERAWNPASATYHANEVATIARRRRLSVLGEQLQQKAENPACDVDVELSDLAKQVEDLQRTNTNQFDLPQTVTELCAMDITPDWLVPGLLERGDRLVITGFEGHGKSTLIRQLAVTLAAGLHPFKFTKQPPLKVYMVDCENGPRFTARKMDDLFAAVINRGIDVPTDRLRIDSRPEGLDLTKPDDAGWLLRRVTAVQPDVLFIGPLYRLHAQDPNKEEPARKMVSALDACRARVGCSMVMEAHAGHGGMEGRQLRPTGSSLLLRWPEFGYGLKQRKNPNDHTKMLPGCYTFSPWRGPRDERDWPNRLAWNTADGWPWVEDDGFYSTIAQAAS